MTYVYDVLLNFNSELYDFYEWEKDDNVTHIKRINLFKVDSKIFNEILDKKIKLNEDFLLSIFNKCEYFDNRSVKNIPYASLVTDSYRVMGLMFDESGNVIKYSSLLLDEEEDILDISDRLGEIRIDYEIKGIKDKSNDLTRLENHIIKYLKKDLSNSYKDKNINKLKYLYYEYFNKQCDDIDKIYQSLSSELENINEKHFALYNLIKLSYSHKNV